MAYPPGDSSRCLVFFLSGVSLQTAGPYSVATTAAAAVSRLATNSPVAEAGGTMCVKGSLGPESSISQLETRSSTDCWRGCAGLLP